jgi:DNA-binding protein HU-beta
MNKSELVQSISVEAELTKSEAGKALDAILSAITSTLKSDGSVALIGFGTFSVGKRAARQGRNPRTGEPLQIAAANVPSFKAGKALKDACN